MLFFTMNLIAVSFLAPSYVIAQDSHERQSYHATQASFQQEKIPFRVVSWNIENLFDTHHDSLKNDHEFLPDAMRHWNYSRYKKKLVDVARVITAIGEWSPPALVGLCEVENDTVLRDLTRRSPLKELSYRYVMTNSPDLRGIALSTGFIQTIILSFHFHPSVEAIPPDKGFATCQRTSTDRRYARRICLPPPQPIGWSQRIGTISLICSSHSAHGS